ncbi:MerR family transcriptional regulator [Allokutzneria albata]|uniref:DNA-binding transcriptional regulator, MerR family n=1 Tax=Allokutzneria albata TaxID=211114 RepID=A0A1H0AM20_ALLAB|nr:MerR family transcriptional regulator [Allokutzneria albata]SDN33876.1 DNA-binding transcriptional regulator, MerR family [Allokutzneria albata]
MPVGRPAVVGGVLIGELAERTGVSPRSLRYYERQGLLVSVRKGNGYREYDAEAVRTVCVIRSLLAAGLNTETIARMLPCMRMDGPRVVPCAGLVEDLDAERRRIDREIAALVHSRGLLSEVIDAARSDDKVTSRG